MGFINKKYSVNLNLNDSIYSLIHSYSIILTISYKGFNQFIAPLLILTLQTRPLMSNFHYQKVFKSPINTSISKNLYSIPKSQRFQKTRRSECTRSFYEIKSSIDKARTTSFGFGNRTDLINYEPVPEPGYYNTNQSPFHNNKVKRRGYSFGGSPKGGFPNENSDINNPGPGKYDQFFRSRKGYSIRNKYQDPLEKDKNPLGPGQYKVTQNLDRTGMYFNSRFKNSGCGKIGRQKRFGDDSTPVPGPGAYPYRFSINRSGSYYDSRIKSNLVPSFQGTYRPPINERSEAPGPGTYFYFSEFGSRMG